jgi:hypothetical protein
VEHFRIAGVTVLLFHGALDRNVGIDESRLMAIISTIIFKTRLPADAAQKRGFSASGYR